MWIVHPIISEESDRTTSEDIANFLNQAEVEGLKLVAMDQGFFFFKALNSPAVPPPADDLEEEQDVVYDERAPQPQTHPGVLAQVRRAPAPDPSIRSSGTDLDPKLFAAPGTVRVDPRVLHQQSQPVVPNAQPHSNDDPFGLG